MNNSNANLSNSHEATAMKVNKSRKSSKLRNHNRVITERVRRGLRNGPPRGRNWQENAPKSGRHAHLYKYYTRKILKSNLNAEAAKLKISMMPEVLAESITHILKHSTFKNYIAEDLSTQTAYTYKFYQVALEEIDKSGYQTYAISIETVKEKMPNTLHFLEAKIKNHATMRWNEFIKNPAMISKVIGEVRRDISGFIESNKNSYVARSIANDMKIIHRIPQGQDMAIFSKYQTQLDTDIDRAMKGLYEYRNNKAKLIEGEVIEDLTAH